MDGIDPGWGDVGLPPWGTPPEEPTDGIDIDELLKEWADDQADSEASKSSSSSATVGSSSSVSKTVSSNISMTEQISRRYVDVPTEEEFLNDFSTAFAGFIQNMRDVGVGASQINLMLDPSTGIMQTLMTEYMGELAQRAAKGEDIYELVGTEEDYTKIREEPGSSSVGMSSGTSETEGASESSSASKSSSESAGAESGEVTHTGESTSTSKESSTSKSTSEQTGASIYKETTEVYSRPGIAAVYKFSPTDFLFSRFKDPGHLATFVESKKGEQTRQAQTLTGGTVAQARRVR